MSAETSVFFNKKKTIISAENNVLVINNILCSKLMISLNKM